MKFGFIVPAALLSLVFGAADAAQVYKCKQGGSTVFSATPCGADSQSVTVTAPNIGSVAPEQPAKLTSPVEDVPESAKVQASAPEQKSACSNASSSEVRRSIIEEKVFVGMRQADVERAWGKPSRINRSSYGDDQWVYDRAASSQYVYIGAEGCVTAWN